MTILTKTKKRSGKLNRLKNLFAKLGRKKVAEEPEQFPVKTAYDVAHDLYCQMIQRPVQEHDEIVYTFIRLHCPKKHLHSNPKKKPQVQNAA